MVDIKKNKVKLWKEHFGFTDEECVDPLAKQTWEAVARRAASNTVIFRKIFGCYPDDNMTKKKQIEEEKSKSRINMYEQLSPSIKGHIVEFPLNFLEKQPVKEEKE